MERLISFGRSSKKQIILKRYFWKMCVWSWKLQSMDKVNFWPRFMGFSTYYAWHSWIEFNKSVILMDPIAIVLSSFIQLLEKIWCTTQQRLSKIQQIEGFHATWEYSCTEIFKSTSQQNLTIHISSNGPHIHK